MNARTKVMVAEARLWVDHLAVLKAAIDLGKPDALQRVKGEIERLDGEMSALVNRREVLAQSQANQAKAAKGGFGWHGIERVAEAAQRGGYEKLLRDADEGVARIAQQIADLAAILQSVKLAPREEDSGPTPEFEARPTRRNAILTLELNGSISHEQAVAANTIARVFEAISRAGQAKIGRTDTAGRAGGGYREPDMPYELDVLRNAVYIPWAEHLRIHGPVALDIAIKVAVYGLALNRVRRRHRIGWDAGLGKLRDALDLFNKKARDHRREQQQEINYDQ